MRRVPRTPRGAFAPTAVLLALVLAFSVEACFVPGVITKSKGCKSANQEDLSCLSPQNSAAGAQGIGLLQLYRRTHSSPVPDSVDQGTMQVTTPKPGAGEAPGTDHIGFVVRLTSKKYPDYAIRHRFFQAWCDMIDESSMFQMDSSFTIRDGLAKHGSISFESENYPGHFLRYSNDEVWLHHDDGTDTFKKDASFYEREPLDNSSGFKSYESVTCRNCYLRQNGHSLRIDRKVEGSFTADATWKPVYKKM